MPPPSAPLARALDGALRGTSQPLRDLLARGSRLPGPRMNVELAEAFADACQGAGPRAEAVAMDLARLPADLAPGATALEFLPVCGVYALAARGAATPGDRARVLRELHARADDLRFRVREAVIDGLSKVGGAAGDALLDAVGPWMDGYFHAAAVLLAMARAPWLTSLHDAGTVCQRLDDAFALARDAPRAAARYPGHKALLDALVLGARGVAVRFGVPVVDRVVVWAAEMDPPLREVVERIADPRGLPARVRADLERIGGALGASRPPARNPDHDHGPSRDRSGRRRRGRGQ